MASGKCSPSAPSRLHLCLRACLGHLRVHLEATAAVPVCRRQSARGSRCCKQMPITHHMVYAHTQSDNEGTIAFSAEKHILAPGCCAQPQA